MNDVTIQDMLELLAARPDTNVEHVMARFDLQPHEAQEVLDVTERFMAYPPEYQKAALRFWEWKNDR